jgi:hypothetical protein
MTLYNFVSGHELVAKIVSLKDMTGVGTGL